MQTQVLKHVLGLSARLVEKDLLETLQQKHAVQLHLK